MVPPAKGCPSTFITCLYLHVQLGTLKNAQFAIDLHGDSGAAGQQRPDRGLDR
jgi:hypothetical protein